MMKPRQLKHTIPTKKAMLVPFPAVTIPCRTLQIRLHPIISALLTFCVLQGNGIGHAHSNANSYESKGSHWQMQGSTAINQKEKIMKTQIVNSSQAGSGNNTLPSTPLTTSSTSLPNAIAAKPPLTTLHNLQTDSLSLQAQALKATGNITTNSTLNISNGQYLGSSGNISSKHGSVILGANNTLISGGSVNALNGSASIGSTQGNTSIANASINAGNVNVQGGGVFISGTIRAGGNIKISGKNVQISDTTIQSTGGSVKLGGTEKTEVLASTIDANNAQIGNADSKTSIADVRLNADQTQVSGSDVHLLGDISSRGDLNTNSDKLSSSANVRSSDGTINLSANTTQITGGDIQAAQGASVGKIGGTISIQSGLELPNVTVQGQIVPLISDDADDSDKTKP